MDRTWRLLPATHPAVPVLLVSTVLGSESYAVHVTDLVHVWAEQLDRRALCMRAFQANTPIDPSYDAEQMGVFLGKVRDALNGEGTLSLKVEGDGDLVLTMTGPLPEGLAPLVWPLHLKRQPATAIASNLVLPLVQAHARRQRERAHLVALLRDKDAVIQRLADKLEALGADVASAFPVLTKGGAGGSQKKGTRADVEQRLRGLAPFADDQAEVGGEDAASVRHLFADVFGRSPLRSTAADAQALTLDLDLDGWWQALGEEVSLAGKDQAAVTIDEGRPADDGVQTTPTRPVSRAEPAGSQMTSPAPAKTQTTVPTRQKGGLGKIGRLGAIGKKEKVAAPVPEPEPEPTPAPEPVPAPSDDDETASEAEVFSAPVSAPPAEARSPTKTTTDTGKVSSPEAPDYEGPPPPTTPSPAKRAKGGLGRIGGKAKKTEAGTPTADTATTEPAPDPKPENKRTALLEQAVAKHAAPVRKKRKF